MLNRILVAVDSSEFSEQVFKQALSMSKALKASLMLLHVLVLEEQSHPERFDYSYWDYYPGLNDSVMEVYQQQYQHIAQRNLSLLDSYKNQAVAESVNTDYLQVPGDPGRAICKLAQTWHADLILVGRRGLTGVKELLLGSVSNYVLHHAPCSVVILHPASIKQELSPKPDYETA